MKHDIKKKQKYWLRKLFRYNSSPSREDDIRANFLVLRKLARTKEHEEVLKLIEHETIPSVRAVWIDYLLEKTKSSK